MAVYGPLVNDNRAKQGLTLASFSAMTTSVLPSPLSTQEHIAERIGRELRDPTEQHIDKRLFVAVDTF